MTVKISPQERFWRKVNIPEDWENECWEYGAGKHWTGYGVFWFEGKTIGAHRYAYESSFGPVPKGYCLDHLCRNRVCVNPWHLEAVTPTENKLRGVSPVTENAAKTHCKHGHEFTPENTVTRIEENGGKIRSCLACRKNPPSNRSKRRSWDGVSQYQRKRMELKLKEQT